MGFFGITSKSKAATNTFSGVNNSDAGSVSASALTTGRGNTVALPGGINIGDKATLHLTSTDNGAALAGLGALSDAFNKQASLTSQAINGFNGLAETKITDGANLNAGTMKIGLYVIGGIAAVVLAFLFFRR